MWIDRLEEVKELKARFGEQANNGAENEEMDRFAEAVQERLGIQLPQQYIEVLNVINGIEFNGHILYGIDEEFLRQKSFQCINGFIELNETWYENENLRQYGFIGEGDMSWFVYTINGERFIELDKPSGNELCEFESIYAVVDRLLYCAIGH